MYASKTIELFVDGDTENRDIQMIKESYFDFDAFKQILEYFVRNPSLMKNYSMYSSGICGVRLKGYSLFISTSN